MSRSGWKSVRNGPVCLRLAAILSVLQLLTAPYGVAAADPPDQKSGDSSSANAQSDIARLQFFESKVRPLLIENCIKCHGPEKQEGSLRLDSRNGILAGGDTGPAIDLDKPSSSRILSAVRYEEFEMPPNKRLQDEEIEVLSQWVTQGAVWPQSESHGLELRRGKKLDDEDRNYWAFRPLTKVDVPKVDSAIDGERVRNEIDAFIIAKLEEKNLRLAPEAGKQVLLRRLYFDLVGVPPTPDEIAEFMNDDSDKAYEKLVDRLLDDNRYGERWARHWLDLVRYAESDGFKSDSYRPTAYLYRDYVIDSLNADKPYDQFTIEQLAGDEIPNADSNTLAATGYLRHWIYEYNQRDVRTQWSNILNDLTDVTGEVFLGLGLGCARCHDHKFDPLLQKDYYRLQASFAAFLPNDTALFGTSDEIQSYREQLSQWESKTAEIRAQMEAIERTVQDKVASKAIDKFPPDIRPILRSSENERGPYEQQLADLAYRQIVEERDKIDYAKSLKGEDKEKWEALKAQFDEHKDLKPKKRETILAARDTGKKAPPTHIPPVKPDSEVIEPATLEVFGGTKLVSFAPQWSNSTGRRLALANWINDPANPLPHRVIVNRIWQYHFGKGIVGNASDFGRLGQPPTHPELLDWLANWWLENGRSWKKLHRLIVTSSTYRQASQNPQREQFDLVDHANDFLWHFQAKRLDAEQVRDALLVATGSIDWKRGGPASDHTSTRRTIYTKVMRNKQDPLLNVLDGPDGNGTVAKRSTTTTAVQSLLLVNSPWPIGLSDQMATRLRKAKPSTEDQIRLAYVQCFAREPSDRELKIASDFMDSQMRAINEADAANPPEQSNKAPTEPDSKAVGEKAASSSVDTNSAKQDKNKSASDAEKKDDDKVKTTEPVSAYSRALSDLCHALLNSSEFLYID